MDCFGTDFTHVQTCDVTRVQSATQYDCFGAYFTHCFGVRLSVFGFRFSAFGLWPSACGFRFSSFGFRLPASCFVCTTSAFGFRLSAFVAWIPNPVRLSGSCLLPWENPSYFWLTAVGWACFSGHVWVHLALVAVFDSTWIFAAHFGPSFRLRCVRLLRVLRITRFFDDLRTLGAKLWTSLGFDVLVVWNVGKGRLNSEQGWLKGRVLLKFIDTCHTRFRKVTESWQRLNCKQHAGDRD